MVFLFGVFVGCMLTGSAICFFIEMSKAMEVEN